MSFVKYTVNFSEEDDLGLTKEHGKQEIVINTNQITWYNQTDDGNIVVHLSDGQEMVVPLGMEKFEEVLCTVEAIITLEAINEN